MKKVLGFLCATVVLLGLCVVMAQAQAPVAPVAAAAPAAVQAPAAPAAAAAPAAVQAPADMFTYGGDIRIREEYREEIPPVPASPAPSQFNYLRFRTRVWGEVAPLDNIAIRMRLCNEVRDWEDPDMSASPDAKTYVWPDELVIDNLYVDIRNLLDKQLDIRIGRQDLFYGTGKVICDGTPGDGSRTLFFDAVKVSWKGVPNTVIDVLGMYDQSIADLIVNSTDRDLTGYPKAKDEVTESGGGIYVVNKSVPDLTIEAYDIYKEEGSYDQAATPDTAVPGTFKAPSKAWQSFDSVNGIYGNPALKLNTVGFRLVPKLGSALDGNLEAAYQFGTRGDEDAQGMMVDAGLTYKVPVAENLAPTVKAGVYYLSGDDPNSAKDEGWDPLYARWPQNSELYVYSYDVGRWSNLMMSTLSAAVSPIKDILTTTVSISYLTAPEDDGPGTGDVRGTLYVAKAEYTVAQNMLREKDKLAVHAWIEVLQPGNYYATDEDAIFARWQIMYTF